MNKTERVTWQGADRRIRCLLLALLAALLLPCAAGADLAVHFIDVGEGDAILVLCDGENLLVDAGPAEAGNAVNAYIRKTGLDALNYVIATHAHDDHLAGMPDALSGLQVSVVYSSRAIRTTYWVDNVMPRLNQNYMGLLRPEEQESFSLGNATVTFLDTHARGDNANDYSLVVRIDYGQTSVLLTADIEGEGEMNLVDSGAPIRADVLKVAHHGGNTSTGEAFLKAVAPRYAVISVGQGNKHGHPHPEPLVNLEKQNVVVYRTDLDGTVIGTSDGENWTFEVSKAR